MTERHSKFTNYHRATLARERPSRSVGRQGRRSISPDAVMSNRSSRDSSSAYTPPWLSPEERAKLRARVSRLRALHMEQQRKKEEETLLKARGSSMDSKKSKNKSRASQKTAASGIGEEQAALPVAPSDGSIRSRMSKKPSRDNLSKKPSETPLVKNKSRDNMRRREKKPKNKNETEPEKHSPKYPSGNTMAADEERQLHPNALDEHLWATECEDFDPQLYHFKSPMKLSTKNPVSVECPPFWVLLDHTIAVTWKLFNNKSDRKYLGIIPLQWSLEFVTAMIDERGDYLPAIGRVKSVIEDALIDRYAKATDKVSKGEKSEGENEENDPPQREKLEHFSSDSVFQYNPEVSYTLKDILSRNIPGRKPLVEEPIVHKVIPANKAPPPESGEIPLEKDDIIGYLRQLKMEQDAVIAREKQHAEKLDALIKLVSKGDIRPEMFFQENETEDKPDRSKIKRDPVQRAEDEKAGKRTRKISPGYEEFKRGKNTPNRAVSQSSIQSAESKVSYKSKKSKASTAEPRKSKSSKRGQSMSSGGGGSATEEENT